MPRILLVAALVALLVGLFTTPAEAGGRRRITTRYSRTETPYGTRTSSGIGVRTREVDLWVDNTTYKRRDDSRYRRSGGYRGTGGAWMAFEDDSNLTSGEIRGMMSDPNFWGKQQDIERERDSYFGGFGRRYRR